MSGFKKDDVVELTAEGLAEFDREARGSVLGHNWNLGDRFTILQRRGRQGEYLVKYHGGGEGLYPIRLIDERWAKVSP